LKQSFENCVRNKKQKKLFSFLRALIFRKQSLLLPTFIFIQVFLYFSLKKMSSKRRGGGEGGAREEDKQSFLKAMPSRAETMKTHFALLRVRERERETAENCIARRQFFQMS
jgi:hypothetical protein